MGCKLTVTLSMRIANVLHHSYDAQESGGYYVVVCEQGLQPAAWPEALDAVKSALEGVDGSEIKAISGKLADAESMIALKVGMKQCRTPISQDGSYLQPCFQGFLGNESDLSILYGMNHSRIRCQHFRRASSIL